MKGRERRGLLHLSSWLQQNAAQRRSFCMQNFSSLFLNVGIQDANANWNEKNANTNQSQSKKIKGQQIQHFRVWKHAHPFWDLDIGLIQQTSLDLPSHALSKAVVGDLQSCHLEVAKLHFWLAKEYRSTDVFLFPQLVFLHHAQTEEKNKKPTKTHGGHRKSIHLFLGRAAGNMMVQKSQPLTKPPQSWRSFGEFGHLFLVGKFPRFRNKELRIRTKMKEFWFEHLRLVHLHQQDENSGCCC